MFFVFFQDFSIVTEKHCTKPKGSSFFKVCISRTSFDTLKITKVKPEINFDQKSLCACA